jgi:hypothetical protein
MDEQEREYRAALRAEEAAGRRTVTIQGRPDQRYVIPSTPARRASQRAHERPGFRPDRVAMWAVLLGIVMLLVAATSSHAAVLAHTLPH